MPAESEYLDAKKSSDKWCNAAPHWRQLWKWWVCPADLCCSLSVLPSTLHQFHHQANRPPVHPFTCTQLKHPPSPPGSHTLICADIIFHPVGEFGVKQGIQQFKGKSKRGSGMQGKTRSLGCETGQRRHWWHCHLHAFGSHLANSSAEAEVTTDYHDLSDYPEQQLATRLAPSRGRTKNILFIGGGVLGGLHGRMCVD